MPLSICQSRWKEIRNALPVIHRVRRGPRTRISALLACVASDSVRPKSGTRAIFARSPTLVPRTLLPNRTETLATQAKGSSGRRVTFLPETISFFHTKKTGPYWATRESGNVYSWLTITRTYKQMDEEGMQNLVLFSRMNTEFQLEWQNSKDNKIDVVVLK